MSKPGPKPMIKPAWHPADDDDGFDEEPVKKIAKKAVAAPSV